MNGKWLRKVYTPSRGKGQATSPLTRVSVEARGLVSDGLRVLVVALGFAGCQGEIGESKGTWYPPASTEQTSMAASDAGGVSDAGGLELGTNSTSTANTDSASPSLTSTDAGASCGNGRVEANEQCDSDAPNCEDCRLIEGPPTCGNGVVEDGEQCDAVSEVCLDCVLVVPFCGDNVVQSGEDCDDGNDDPADGCKHCRLVVCGDGVPQDGEECDPPGERCTEACLVLSENCGDGIVQGDEGEQCDDGNDARGDACFQCRKECGDGRVDRSVGETCEPGLAFLSCRKSVEDQCYSCLTADDCESRDICSPLTCSPVPACGNGVLEAAGGETCEPPGSARCTAACKLVPPVCGNDKLESGEECDPPDGEVCSARCTHMACGNRVVEGNEECEPPNGTTCDDSCRVIQPCVPTLPEARSDVNLLPNQGTFDDDVSGWQTSDARVNLLHVEGDGAADPGALQILLDNGTTGGATLEGWGARVCVSVDANTQYTFSGDYRFAADATPSSGTSVALFLYTNPECTGVPLAPSLTRGPKGNVASSWTRYEASMDTGLVGEQPAGLWMGLRIDVWRPATSSSASVLWDDVALVAGASVQTPVDGYCGDCRTQDAEQCDDGNRAAGDGCNHQCLVERCGNTVLDTGEQCDDGNGLFADGCDPDCTRGDACRACAFAECQSAADQCYHLDGLAESGTRAGTPRGLLCGSLVECIQRTGCAGETAFGGLPGGFMDAPSALENCYCGEARGETCFEEGAPNGSCREEIESALETAVPATILQRLSGSDERYPAFASAASLLQCTTNTCSACNVEVACGNGVLQERRAEFLAFQPQPLIDGRVSTLGCDDLAGERCYPLGSCGCFLEECDDGNSTGGDGCDEQCFVERCGNGVLQLGAGERCDDGNTLNGDGCGSSCQPEWVCGDGVVEGTEQCDDGNSEEGDGCSEECFLEVCGNGILDPGEDCEPPGSATCDETCKRGALDPCTECVFQVDPYAPGSMANCPGAAFLSVSPYAPEDEFNGLRCLEDEECAALWACISTTHCWQNNRSCYCGPEISIAECIAPSFEPLGACASEVKAAYRAQWGNTTADSLLNQEIVEKWPDFFVGPTGRRSLGTATQTWEYCAGDATILDLEMCSAGITSVARRAQCSVACFGASALDDSELLDESCL